VREPVEEGRVVLTLRARIVCVALCGVMLGLAVAAGSPSAVAGGQYSLSPDVSPPLASASTDRERAWKQGCVGFERDTSPPYCVYGDKTASYTIALVGDSHLSHLLGAFEVAAQRNGWRLLVFFKINCPFIDMRVRSVALKREYTECATWNERVVRRVNEAKPDLVVTAWFTIRHVVYEDRTVERKAAAIARMLGRLDARSVILADTPASRVDVPVCLADNRDDIRPCATPRKRALSGHATIERAAANVAGVPLVDLANDICVASPCPAVVNNAIVFRDYHHLTNSFSRTLGPAVDRLISPHR
jgi:hypothetical protein